MHEEVSLKVFCASQTTVAKGTFVGFDVIVYHLVSLEFALAVEGSVAQLASEWSEVDVGLEVSLEGVPVLAWNIAHQT